MRERGTVSVEVAAVLPLLATAMLMVAQTGLVVAEQLTVMHAAREGARHASISGDDDAARVRALEAGSLDEARADVSITPPARDVGVSLRVAISYRPTVMPVLDRFVPDGLLLRGSVTMRAERASGDA